MQITKGNLKPSLEVTIVDSTGPVDFAAATGGVGVVGRIDNVVVVSHDAADGVVATSNGVVTMPWEEGDTDVVGRMSIEIVASWPDGPQSFWPDDVVEVLPARAEFITLRELLDYMSDIDLNEAQEAAAQLVLRGVTRNLERDLARRFVEGVYQERVYAAEDGFGLLRGSPVKQIISVDSVAPLALPTYASWSGVRPTHGGVLGLWPLTWQIVEYRGGGGLDETDLDDVRWAILEKVAQIMTNRHDDTVSVKDLDTREPTFRGEMRWTAEEREQFNRLRRKIVL